VRERAIFVKSVASVRFSATIRSLIMDTVMINPNHLAIARETVARLEEVRGRYIIAYELRQGKYDEWERVQCAYNALQLLKEKM
jgi:hypothetical protein